MARSIVGAVRIEGGTLVQRLGPAIEKARSHPSPFLINSFGLFPQPRPAVLNLLRLDDHFKNLSLGRGLPVKIVPWKIAKIGLFELYQ